VPSRLFIDLGADLLVNCPGGVVSFTLYILGYVIFIVGIALGAHYLHVPPRWITVMVLIFAGLGVARGVSHTRSRDPS
jgi:hypothetical protein